VSAISQEIFDYSREDNIMITKLKRIKAGVFLFASIVISSATAQESQITDLTGQDVSLDQLVSALDIPTRGIGAKCEPYQEQMTSMTRGISSMMSGAPAATIPDLKPVKSASISASFEINSAKLTPDARSLLQTVATAMNSTELSAQCFQLAGHTCDLGSDGYNLELSRKRADSVKHFLVSEGVDPERLVTTGFGETSPLVPNDADESREKNRRVDLGALPTPAMEYQ
jgi:outer membrane protein OmpA-like peptidoglycan-associated protein